ncbi:hypothetical protein [Vallitalea sp.]|jgi:hypothetical protein|uniref:hypothetical protein n=1 Tax=Vallitalea sp. TaxID=1882829 RepID=UPI0025D9A7F8|nr:hypothetical protein [Vallitalea sp.]MCT4686957.1 hypothetical protein [Vallitalea sp.]
MDNPDVGFVLRLQANGKNYLSNNDCVAYLQRQSGRRGYKTVTTSYDKFIEEHINRRHVTHRDSRRRDYTRRNRN